MTPFADEQPVLCSPVCLGIIAKLRAIVAYFGGRRADFLCSSDLLAGEQDSNSHYRFEFRNFRGLRNLQTMQHLTRESTGAESTQTVHLFVRHSGEGYAIVWLKVVRTRPAWFPETSSRRLLAWARSPKAKDLSAEWLAREK